jgi:hypothetical protein
MFVLATIVIFVAGITNFLQQLYGSKQSVPQGLAEKQPGEHRIEDRDNGPCPITVGPFPLVVLFVHIDRLKEQGIAWFAGHDMRIHISLFFCVVTGHTGDKGCGRFQPRGNRDKWVYVRIHVESAKCVQYAQSPEIGLDRRVLNVAKDVQI